MPTPTLWPTQPRILFDEAHGEWISIEGNYRELADHLRENGYIVDRITTTPISYGILTNYDVYVVGTPWGSFDSSEIDAIARFVEEGGGLFLTGLGWSWVNPDEGRTLDNYPPNLIGSHFGIRFLDDAICDPDNPYDANPCTPVFYPRIGHQVLEGLGGLGGPIYAAPITTTQTIAFPLLTAGPDGYSNGGRYSGGTYPPVAVGALYGRGRVLALGHEGYLGTDDHDSDGTPNLYDHDNLQFGLNAIDWLAKHSSQPLPWLEIYFDDGNPEFGFVAWPGGLGAVRFTVPSGARVQKLRFYIWGDMDPVNVHILDRSWMPLFTRTVTPSPGWFEVDVSDANVITDGEFYVAWQWLEDASGGPWLGFDNTLPHYHHSYLGDLDPANPPHVVSSDNYFIRAVVSYPADILAATPTPTQTPTVTPTPTATPTPGLSPEDHRELTACLQTISSGWVQPAVDQCNVILTKPQYDAADWQSFFTEYFDANPFTDDLRNYLGYPVFWWFGEDVHLRLQMGLVAPMETNVERIMQAHPADLGPALAADANLRQTLINSHRFLNHILVLGIVYATTKQSIYDFYRAHIGRYPGFLRADVVINNSAQPYVAVVRAQVHMNLRDAVPLTPQVKDEIAQTLGLSGRRLDIWNQSSVLVIDNLGLDSVQLNVIYNLLASIPQSLHQLGAITQNDLLGNTGGSIWFASRSVVNIFDIDVGASRENGFPSDVAPRYSDVFSLVLAHEVNHAVDANSISPDSTLNSRRNALIQQAGDNHMNYLRSMFEDGFFTQYPQEFFASIANQWFSDSHHTLDLGVLRFRNGYREPINQALFFAEVYSQGSNTTRFYTLDTEGQITLIIVPITRDTYGHINALTVDGATYAFELDSAGNVVNILAAP